MYHVKYPGSFAFAIITATGLAACVASGPMYEQPNKESSASIIRGSGQFSLSAAHGWGDAASCTVKEIDGLPTRRPAEPKRVLPGSHRLGLEAIHAPGIAVGYLDVELQQGREYQVQARESGIGYLITLLDITDKKGATPVKTVKMLKTGEMQRQSSPIFIPIVVH